MHFAAASAASAGPDGGRFMTTRDWHSYMRQVTWVANRAHPDRALAFLAAVVSLTAVFAAVGSTIPLFNIYRADEGFTNAGISLTVVAYSAATLSTLLVAGRLSTHVGRRPIAIISLALLILGCLLLLKVHDIGILIAGRFLMGLGAGLASSSLTAYIVDAAPTRPAWLASVASSQTVMLGLAIGAIASGALVQFGPWPRDLIYMILVGVLLLSIMLVVISPETVTPTPGGWRSLRPSVRVPARLYSLSGLRCFWPPGQPEPSTRPSFPRWSQINFTPTTRSCSDWSSPRTWVPALWALPSADASHRRQLSASA
jgi:MFS family permease